MLGQQSIASKARRRRTEGNESPELQVSRLGDDQEVAGSNSAGPSKKNVDDLLPIGVSFSIHGWDLKLICSDYLPHQRLGNSLNRLLGRNGLMSWMSTRN